MKKTNILYWIFTGLLAVLMLFGSIPDIMSTPEAVDLIVTHLGYPAYFLPFIGVVKVLGVIAILVPGFPRIREWAYAGFIFDLGGAIYSSIAVGDSPGRWMPLLIGIALIVCSYIFYHKKLRLASKPQQ
jgi:hypothetical protein